MVSTTDTYRCRGWHPLVFQLGLFSIFFLSCWTFKLCRLNPKLCRFTQSQPSNLVGTYPNRLFTKIRQNLEQKEEESLPTSQEQKKVFFMFHPRNQMIYF